MLFAINLSLWLWIPCVPRVLHFCLWSTMGLYMFSFHIPLSFGGLSIVSQLLHTSSLDHQTQAISVLLLQILELVVVSLLLRFSAKPPYKIFSNIEADTMTNERNWLLASVFGFGFLVLLVFVTSLIADSLIGPKDVNNPFTASSLRLLHALLYDTVVVEPFTSHYVFALGVARFLTCSHWILQVLETRGQMLTALGHGLWPGLVIFSEIVQTYILADFCYYYVKSIISGQHVLRLPAGVV
ncbi:ER lumen protein-retaining receptor [Heracleum sosnowskyi]|uniref:ER lumen protein-retaining receptor n=1 Tax=Heracleum sosnowskyi TaxID=360622 RepID=A0AAD8GVF3_9APIA|nr:ER lumen protein-retaining receptor [Heracleum sosnowskyi]